MTDLTPILDAALRATGGDPDADEVEPEMLERAQAALRCVAAHIDKLLGYQHVATIDLTSGQGDL